MCYTGNILSNDRGNGIKDIKNSQQWPYLQKKNNNNPRRVSDRHIQQHLWSRLIWSYDLCKQISNKHFLIKALLHMVYI